MERPTVKDAKILAYVEYLELELKKFTDSPYVNTYTTIKNQIDSFNEQLTIDENQTVERSLGVTEDGITITEKAIKGKIDLFGSKDSKEFDRGWKYMLESVDMNKKLDELRKLMLPSQQKELEEKQKMENLGIAEKIAMNAKNR